MKPSILKRAFRFVSSRYSKWDRLRKVGSGSIGLIDVGSVGGLSGAWRDHPSELSRVLNFDPNEKAIRTGSVITENCGLWEDDSELPFYIFRGFGGTGSSLYLPNFPYVKENFDWLSKRGPADLAHTWFERSECIKEIKLKCRSLDSVLAGLPNAEFHFLKIDAQGAELPILKGASDFLQNKCVALQLELHDLPLYIGTALRGEVVNFLAERGFEIAAEEEPHGTFDSQKDVLFIHRERRKDLQSVIRRVYGLPNGDQ